MRKKIKRIRDTHAISREMFAKMNDPEHANQLIKRESLRRLTEKVYEELEADFVVEENPWVGTTQTIDIVTMPTSEWRKIERFLLENKFKFEELVK